MNVEMNAEQGAEMKAEKQEIYGYTTSVLMSK